MTKELYVPEFVLRRVESLLSAKNFTVHFGKITLDPTGRFLLENVRVFSPTFDEPLLTARAVYARIEFWPLLVGDVRLGELHLTGADFFLPAPLSRSGIPENELSQVDLVLINSGKGWDIGICSGWCDNLPFQASGPLPLPEVREEKPSKQSPVDYTKVYLEWAQKLSKYRDYLHLVQSPSLVLELRSKPVRVHVAASAAEIQFPGNFDFKQVQNVFIKNWSVTTEVPLDAQDAVDHELLFAAEKLQVPGQVEIDSLKAHLRGSIDSHFVYEPTRLDLAIRTVKSYGETAESVGSQSTFLPLPETELKMVGLVRGQPFSLEGSMNLDTHDGRASAEFSPSPALIADLGNRFGHFDIETVAHLSTPPHLAAEAVFSGGQLARLTTDFSVTDALASGVHIDVGHARLEYDPKKLVLFASDAFMRTGTTQAGGTYEMNTETFKYRFLLEGDVLPLAIAPWFDPSWKRFWQSFEFPGQPAHASVDVQGRWGHPENDTIYVMADVPQPIVRKVPLDRVRALLFIRPPDFYDAREFKVEKKNGSTSGTFRRVETEGPVPSVTTDFDAVSTMELADLGPLFGADGIGIVKPFHFSQAPKLTMRGQFVEFDTAESKKSIDLKIESRGPMTYYDFPLSDLKVTGKIHDDDIALEDVQAGFGGGTVLARATITGPDKQQKLKFDYNLTDAELSQAIKDFETFKAAGKPAVETGKATAGKTRGKLKLAVAAEGNLDDVYSFHGDGNAEVTNGDLAEINLLGPLSALLRLRLRLDTAHMPNFQVDGRRLIFPNLKLTGNTAAIEAHGSYDVEANDLDFTARIQPFSQKRNIISGALDLVLTLPENFLPVKLTGKLDDPKWAFVLGPTNFIRNLSKPLEAIRPEPPQGAVEKPTPADSKEASEAPTTEVKTEGR